MFYSFHIPARPLSEFVERFWCCSDSPAHSRERILPSGTFELVINLAEDEIRIYDPHDPERYSRFPGAVVSGTYASPFVIDPSQHAAMMGIHFKPGGAFPFLGHVVGDLTNRHVALEDLWGQAAKELRERLCAATSSANRYQLLQSTLEDRLSLSQPHHPVVPMALRLFGRDGNGESVRSAAKRVGLSQRRFIQVFTDEVGLTPKLYCRVLRFQAAQSLVGLVRRPEWASIAMCCGYFDQSHLIRDFRQFSGMSPTDYLRLRNDRVMVNHLPVVD